MDVVKFGSTSLTLRCEVRNKLSRKTILKVENITLVNLNEDGIPVPHNKTKIEYVRDRLEELSKD